MWKAYLKRIKYKDELSFSEVMDVVRERLQPMMGGDIEHRDRYCFNEHGFHE
jgi:hypothetical protein